MKSISVTALVLTAVLWSSCGYSSMPGNTTIAPTVTGAWTLTFTPTGAAQATTLTANFSQNGNSFTGQVTSVNNPDTACFAAITSQSRFTITGQTSAQSQSNSNLSVSVAFTSGSSNGTITGTGALAYLGTMATGTFSFPAGSSGCTSGSFTMTQG